jgi:hypothetical protein
MEDLLIATLETFGYPVKLQGSLLENEPYPNHFFTFWNNSSAGNSFYDNAETSTAYDYDVNFYSSDPTLVYSVMREAKEKLKAAGFIVSGDGYSVASDEPTHDGRGMNVKCLNT